MSGICGLTLRIRHFMQWNNADRTADLPPGAQYNWRNCASVRSVGQHHHWSWTWRIINRVRWLERGRMMGCWVQCCNGAFVRRPPTLRTPSQSKYGVTFASDESSWIGQPALIQATLISISAHWTDWMQSRVARCTSSVTSTRSWW